MRRRDERGSGTVLVLVHAEVLLFLGVALSAVGGVILQHRAAGSAADLAALAGARTLADGGAGCAAATEIAAANRARLAGCSVEGREVTVRVVVPPPSWPPWLPNIAADARAGPELGH